MAVTAVLPAGTYYVGDICYVLDETLYDTFWGMVNDYKEGKYTVNAGTFVVANTAYGDGVYVGSDGFTYGVDSGTIGMVQSSIIDKNRKHFKFTKKYRFKTSVSFTFLDGIFTITNGLGFHLTIDTS